MVQITIDTKRDSQDEIRRTIRYLQSIVGDNPVQDYGRSNNESSPTPASAGAFNMFGSDDDAPSDLDGDDSEERSGDEIEEQETFIEIVEY